MSRYPYIILASKSPRRDEILNTAGLAHRIIVSDADEDSIEYTPGMPEKLVTDTAGLKNDAVYSSLISAGAGDIPEDAVILSADTVVYHEERREIFGKPHNAETAFGMLSSLSGRRHRVITGVVLRRLSDNTIRRFTESTEVYFRTLSDEDIREYIEGEKPFDKAGAYGIQEGACLFVEKINGDYLNVVGLPVSRICAELREMQTGGTRFL